MPVAIGAAECVRLLLWCVVYRRVHLAPDQTWGGLLTLLPRACTSYQGRRGGRLHDGHNGDW